MEDRDAEVTCSRYGLVDVFWSMVEEDDPTEVSPSLRGAHPWDLEWTIDGRRRLRRGRALSEADSEFSDSHFDYLDIPAMVRAPPPWGVRFTTGFRRDLRQLDRKLQGRVLETILEITDYPLPFKAMGDTFKPLHGDLKGQWRYRLGDHRLVVKPLEKAGDIELLTFASRGSVYD